MACSPRTHPRTGDRGGPSALRDPLSGFFFIFPSEFFITRTRNNISWGNSPRSVVVIMPDS